MTYKELARDIGKPAVLRVQVGEDSLRLCVKVIDCRVVFGRTDYQVEYDNGSVQHVWSNSANVNFIKESDALS